MIAIHNDPSAAQVSVPPARRGSTLYPGPRAGPSERASRLTCPVRPPSPTPTPSHRHPLHPRPSPPPSPQANGIRAAGNKFFCLQANPRSIYGKKQADGIILVKTTQAILVAEYSHPTVPGEATKVVEELADYLVGVGY